MWKRGLVWTGACLIGVGLSVSLLGTQIQQVIAWYVLMIGALMVFVGVQLNNK